MWFLKHIKRVILLLLTNFANTFVKHQKTFSDADKGVFGAEFVFPFSLALVGSIDAWRVTIIRRIAAGA